MFPKYLADLAPPMGETRNFNYCIRLENLTDYSEYLIVAKLSSQVRGEEEKSFPPSPVVLKSGTCSSMRSVLMSGVYYRPQITLFAVPKSKVTPNDLFKLESNTLRIVDPIGNLMGIFNSQNQVQYFNPKIQEQVQQRDPHILNYREGDKLLPVLYSETVLKSPKILESKGIPASPPIVKPDSVPFWDSGKTIEGHYTITTLAGNTFTIKKSGSSTDWMGVHLLILPLLGVILLVMVKWYHQRSRLSPSDNHSETSNHP
jgi:hypothetical protein